MQTDLTRPGAQEAKTMATATRKDLRFSLWLDGLLVVALLMTSVGCSGDGGADGSASGPVPIPAPGTGGAAGGAPAVGRGDVAVTVRDVLWAMVPGATVRAWVPSESTSYTAVTDGSGRVELKGLRAGELNLTVSSADAWRSSTGHVIKADAVVQIDAIVRPEAPAAGGVTWAWVPPGGLSADGKTLVFSLEFVDVPNEAYGGFKHFEGPQSAYIEPCTPDAANDGDGHQADCVLGVDTFDAAYSPVGDGPMLVQVEDVSLFTGRSYAAALLLDQSDHVIANDPSDVARFVTPSFARARRPA